MAASAMFAFIFKELRELIPPTVFFAVGFNLMVGTEHLLLSNYPMQLFNFVFATTLALIIGKAVLLANAMPLLRRFDASPLIMPVLFKTVVYSIAALILQVLERLVEYWVGGGHLVGTLRHLTDGVSWNRFAAVHLWTTVLLLIYTAANETNARLGKGVLFRMFFVSDPGRRPLP
ncbi:hypothetical protein ACQW02_08225 [Humitalea sp. 24SJ18S-53]|uniref:hypothetical protein n=1 Tax=Humitalea sp. 24SJ18S-53 TaxID=3422307 RepID=UPI003D67400B